jgi:hypothetical protein
MRPRLVSNWRRAHRMLSVQLTALNGAAVAAWSALPEDWRAAIPHQLVVGAGIALFVGTIVARLVDQGSVTEPKP